MIKLNGERLKRYELNRTVTIAPRHGNRLHEVRVQQSEATEPIPVPTREENGAIIADIPNILLERYGTITVELISIDKHGSKNYEKRSFTIHNQPKPDGYEYEENIGGGGGSGGSGGGGSFIDLKNELTAMGFALGNEEDDMLLEDYLDEEGEYRETIALDESGFEQLKAKLTNRIVCLLDMLAVMQIYDDSVAGQFYATRPNNDKVAFDCFEVEVFKDNGSLTVLFSKSRVLLTGIA